MIWILIAFLFALLYMTFRKETFPNPGPLGGAWMSYIIIFYISAVIAVLQAIVGDPTEVAQFELLANAARWILLAICLNLMLSVFNPKEGTK